MSGQTEREAMTLDAYKFLKRIRPGDRIEVQTASGEWEERIAMTGVLAYQGPRSSRWANGRELYVRVYRESGGGEVNWPADYVRPPRHGRLATR